MMIASSKYLHKLKAKIYLLSSDILWTQSFLKVFQVML